jgi:hypothetical protein
MNDLIITKDNQLAPMTPQALSEWSGRLASLAVYGSSYGPDTMNALVSSGVHAQLDRYAEHVGQPASRAEIVTQLSMLVCAYPTSGSGDLDVYGKVLGDDVLAAKPTLFALEHACRTLRRTSKWRPAIAEVLSEIEEAERLFSKARRALRELPSKLARYNEDRAKRDEERRERIAWCEEELKRSDPNDPIEWEWEDDDGWRWTRKKLEICLDSLRKEEQERCSSQNALMPIEYEPHRCGHRQRRMARL